MFIKALEEFLPRDINRIIYDMIKDTQPKEKVIDYGDHVELFNNTDTSQMIPVIFYAAKCNKLNLIRHLTLLGYEDSNIALIGAASGRHIDLIHAFMSNHDISMFYKDIATIIAARYNYIDEFKRYITINRFTKKLILWGAASSGHMDLVDMYYDEKSKNVVLEGLLYNNAPWRNVKHYLYTEYQSVMGFGIANNNEEYISQCLLPQNQIYICWQTTLYRSIKYHNTRMYEFSIQKGAVLNEKCLKIAVQTGNNNIIELIMNSRNTDINYINSGFIGACSVADWKYIDYFFHLGATSVNTAMINSTDKNVIRFLKEQGASEYIHKYTIRRQGSLFQTLRYMKHLKRQYGFEF